MVETNDGGNQGGNTGGQGATLRVKVDDSEAVKAMEKQLKDLETQLNVEKQKYTQTVEEKEKLVKTVEELEEKKGDLESKLTVVAEEKFNSRVSSNIERVKKLFPEDDEKLKEFEKKLETPEGLKSVEYALDVLEASITKGQQVEMEAFEKSKNELLEKFPDAKDKIEVVKSKSALDDLVKELETGKTGVDGGTQQKTANKRDIPLSGKQLGINNQGDNDDGYEGYRAMVMDLRKRARDPTNPEEQAKAQETLDILFHKWSDFVRNDYRNVKDIDASLGSKERPQGVKAVNEGRDD